MSTRTHPNSAGGRWAWRDYLPGDEAEFRSLMNRVFDTLPVGVDIARFGRWVHAEMAGQPHGYSSATETKFRRVLYELTEGEPTPGGRQRRRQAGYMRSVGDSMGLAVQAATGAVVLHLTRNPALALAAAAAGNPRPVSYVNPTEGELVEVDFTPAKLEVAA